MHQDEAMVFLYNALLHCEGIQDLMDAGIDVCEIQKIMDNKHMIPESTNKEMKLLVKACGEAESVARDELAYLEEVLEESICS